MAGLLSSLFGGSTPDLQPEGIRNVDGSDEDGAQANNSDAEAGEREQVEASDGGADRGGEAETGAGAGTSVTIGTSAEAGIRNEESGHYQGWSVEQETTVGADASLSAAAGGSDFIDGF